MDVQLVLHHWIKAGSVFVNSFYGSLCPCRCFSVYLYEPRKGRCRLAPVSKETVHILISFLKVLAKRRKKSIWSWSVIYTVQKIMCFSEFVFLSVSSLPLCRVPGLNAAGCFLASLQAFNIHTDTLEHKEPGHTNFDIRDLGCNSATPAAFTRETVP